MADNFTLNNTNVSGGPTYRDLDRAGVRTQVVQLDLGGAAAEVLAAGSVPVSMAANTPDVTDRAGRALGTIANTTFGATLAAETTKVIGTVNLAAAQTLAALTAITNALPAGGNSIGTTPGPTLTKGTQGTVGHSTQDLKDAGRVMVTYSATALAGVTTETLINLTPLRDLVAGTAATSHAVTANKRLRLQSISMTLRSTSTVNVGAIVRFRLLAGTVLVGSPVHNSLACMSSNLATAVIGNAQSEQVQFPDGFELSGTMQLGLTQLASASTAALDIHVTGYEY